MKEILAIVRIDKVGKTKEALTEAGIPGFTCRKVMGRGKGIMSDVILSALKEEELPINPFGEYMSEASRLIPKRVFTIMAQDDDVEKIITAIMESNSTGNPGDGKIFVLPLFEAYRVRDGQVQTDSDSY